ncbi:MAG TPA: hypothetical protein VG965_00870 [Patescibacteria group bacterium]|nr:hypothetical protein [Patescibacteria group bacterium]
MISEQPSRISALGIESSDLPLHDGLTDVKSLVPNISRSHDLIGAFDFKMSGLSKETESGSIQVITLGKGLRIRALNTLLHEIAPDKSASYNGIVADWVMPDEHSQYSAKLHDFHKKIGPEWFDFENYRRGFLDMYREAEHMFAQLESTQLLVNSFLTLEDAYEKLPDEKRTHDINTFAINVKQATYDIPQPEQFADIKIAISEYMMYRVDLWTKKEISKGANQSPDRAFRKFWSMNSKFVRKFLGEFYPREDLTDEIIIDYISQKGLVLQCDDGHISFLRQRTNRGFEFTINDGKIISKSKEAFEVASIGHDEDGKDMLVIDAIQEPEDKFVPTIVWIKDKMGNRQVIVDPNSDELKSAGITINHPEQNLLLGLLTLAYLEEAIREDWEKELYIEDVDKDGKPFRRGPQMNGSAQVPVYAIGKREEMAARSQLLPAIEALLAS